ncbi:UTP--glucose-1-phosphate uridylyltransferase [Desulfohalovibrio reitneri]|uniref:UTP--glucose-1-phosphate uridylyltransferase n=1 Tax=Desulfohalovibrio reitneri TaxID=1307759 RepID=UPI00068A45CF|nr:UTP--glucose-1-phosphate uridylyltransferase [Desulfohalovibrio reitneri]
MSHIETFKKKMRGDGLPESVVSAFTGLYQRLASGERGMIPESDLSPLTPDEVPSLATSREHAAKGLELADQAVVLKLNGGLGTSMGLDKAKSLLPVKNGLTFLDIIRRQVERFRGDTGACLPLVLMNSFNTEDDSLAALGDFGNPTGVPLSFLQNRFPKVMADDLSPAEWPDNPSLEWNPPGHGDLYAALKSSGTLDALLERGYHYAFVSNADNLGASFDPALLGLMAETGAPFLMEVARRTKDDRKGGHLARAEDGRLVLREVAQTPDGDLDAFQDIDRHRYFNTNSVWVDLRALNRLLEEEGEVSLSLIANSKTIDPRDPDSPKVFQLETAMGSAISGFPGAAVVEVPRSRFLPVKTTDDLLRVMSDNYRLDDRFNLIHTGHTTRVELDSRYYKKIDEFLRRFPAGVPSLANCQLLRVRGDVFFETAPSLHGEVVVENTGGLPARIRRTEMRGREVLA